MNKISQMVCTEISAAVNNINSGNAVRPAEDGINPVPSEPGRYAASNILIVTLKINSTY